MVRRAIDVTHISSKIRVPSLVLSYDQNTRYIYSNSYDKYKTQWLNALDVNKPEIFQDNNKHYWILAEKQTICAVLKRVKSLPFLEIVKICMLANLDLNKVLEVKKK